MTRHRLWYLRDSIMRFHFLYNEFFLRLAYILAKSSYLVHCARHVMSILYTHVNFFYRTRYRNRCLLRSRARHVHRRWGLSRFGLRVKINKGYLPHVTHASW